MKFKIKRSTNWAQPYYWVIVAANGRTMASSETYTTKSAARDAIAVVKAYAASATIIEEAA